MSFLPRVFFVLASVLALGSAVFPVHPFYRQVLPDSFYPPPSGVGNDVYSRSQFEFVRQLAGLQRPKTNVTSDRTSFPPFFFENFGVNPLVYNPEFFSHPVSNVNSDRFNTFPFNYPGYHYPGYNYPSNNYPAYNYPGYSYPGYNHPGYNYPGYNYYGQYPYNYPLGNQVSSRTIFPYRRPGYYAHIIAELLKNHPEYFNTSVNAGSEVNTNRIQLPYEYPNYKPYSPLYYQ